MLRWSSTTRSLPMLLCYKRRREESTLAHTFEEAHARSTLGYRPHLDAILDALATGSLELHSRAAQSRGAQRLGRIRITPNSRRANGPPVQPGTTRGASQRMNIST